MAITGTERAALAAYDAVAGKADRTTQARGAGEPSFADMLGDVVSDASISLKGAERASFASAVDNLDVVDLAAALSKAEGKLRTIVTVRDRLVSSLQEIFRMPI